MGQIKGLWGVLGALLVGCTGAGATAEPTRSSSLAVKQCQGDDDGRPLAPCAAHRDPALSLGRSACESGRLVGAASSNSALATDPAYVTTLGNEFTYVTPENA